MFKKLVRLLSEGKSYSQHELARELGISEEVLQGYIEFLSEQGVISKLDYAGAHAGCSGACSCCKSCKGCAGEAFFENAPMLWEFKKDKI